MPSSFSTPPSLGEPVENSNQKRSSFQGSDQHHATSWRNLLLSLAFVPHLAPAGQESPVLMQGWTLVFEVSFYACFGAALVLPRRFLLLALTTFFLALALAGLV